MYVGVMAKMVGSDDEDEDDEVVVKLFELLSTLSDELLSFLAIGGKGLLVDSGRRDTRCNTVADKDDNSSCFLDSECGNSIHSRQKFSCHVISITYQEHVKVSGLVQQLLHRVLLSRTLSLLSIIYYVFFHSSLRCLL